MSWDHLGPLPRVTGSLRAQTIQLADFDFGDWSASQGETQDASSTPGTSDESPPSLLSPEVLFRLDARLAVDVDEVVSGKDRLGSMHMVVSLEEGRLTVFPFHLEVPGGRAEIELGYFDDLETVSLDLGMKLSHFDYGVLARRLDPETEMSGLITLDVELSASALTAEELMHHASGHIDVAIMPREFESGVIDLWAVNLVASVLPALDTAPKSQIECAIAHLDVREGQVTERLLVVDTTRMRVAGKAQIDLRKETVELKFSPIAKRPEFFSLATPVSVSGTFDDFGVGVRAEDIMGTVIRFATSVVVVPIQRMIGMKTDLTDDGICERAIARK
jgi:uncharacterized protein involved in outer membrane biogenesis